MASMVKNKFLKVSQDKADIEIIDYAREDALMNDFRDALPSEETLAEFLGNDCSDEKTAEVLTQAKKGCLERVFFRYQEVVASLQQQFSKRNFENVSGGAVSVGPVDSEGKNPDKKLGVGFRREELSQLNRYFEKPETIALLGTTGAGKTTFLNFLLRTAEHNMKLPTDVESCTGRITTLSYGEKVEWEDTSMVTTGDKEAESSGSRGSRKHIPRSLEKQARTLNDAIRAKERRGSTTILENVVNVRLPSPLLRAVTITDTIGPGEIRETEEQKKATRNYLSNVCNTAGVLIVLDGTSARQPRLQDYAWLHEENSPLIGVPIFVFVNKLDCVRPAKKVNDVLDLLYDFVRSPQGLPKLKEHWPSRREDCRFFAGGSAYNMWASHLPEDHECYEEISRRFEVLGNDAQEKFNSFISQALRGTFKWNADCLAGAIHRDYSLLSTLTAAKSHINSLGTVIKQCDMMHAIIKKELDASRKDLKKKIRSIVGMCNNDNMKKTLLDTFCNGKNGGKSDEEIWAECFTLFSDPVMSSLQKDQWYKNLTDTVMDKIQENMLQLSVEMTRGEEAHNNLETLAELMRTTLNYKPNYNAQVAVKVAQNIGISVASLLAWPLVIATAPITVPALGIAIAVGSEDSTLDKAAFFGVAALTVVFYPVIAIALANDMHLDKAESFMKHFNNAVENKYPARACETILRRLKANISNEFKRVKSEADERMQRYRVLDKARKGLMDNRLLGQVIQSFAVQGLLVTVVRELMRFGSPHVGDKFDGGTFKTISEGRWKTEDHEDLKCAIAELRKEHRVDGNSVRRYFLEVYIQQNLVHANILSVYGAVMLKSGSLLVATPVYVPLRRLLFPGHKVPRLDLLHYAICLASGVRYLHWKGIMHRDIKIDNLLVRGRDLVIADLGTAKHVGASCGTEVGTPKNMAPEVLSDRSTVYDERVDIYSLGVTIWSIYNDGKYILEEDIGAEPNRRESWKSQLDKGHRPPRGMCPEDVFERVVEKSWCTYPKDRLTAHGVLDQLHHILHASPDEQT